MRFGASLLFPDDDMQSFDAIMKYQEGSCTSLESRLMGSLNGPTDPDPEVGIL